MSKSSKTILAGISALALMLSAGVASASQDLAQKHACMSCHQMDKKVVGPAFKEVAKKYKGDAKAREHLVTVVKKGGKGVWGAIPMPPSTKVPDADAEAIVDWILTL